MNHPIANIGLALLASGVVVLGGYNIGQFMTRAQHEGYHAGFRDGFYAPHPFTTALPDAILCSYSRLVCHQPPKRRRR